MTTYELNRDSGYSKTKHRKTKLVTKLPTNIDKPITYSIIVLAVFGLIMIASSSMGLTSSLWSLGFILVKQIFYLTFGYLAMAFFAAKFKLSWLKSPSFPYWELAMGALLFVCLFFTSTGDTKAWIRLNIMGQDASIQPSEFAKVMTICIVAAYCGDLKVKEPGPSGWMIMKRPLFFVCIYVFIILVLQSDLGSAAVLVCIACACYLIPKHPSLKKSQRILCLAFFGMMALIVFLLVTPQGEEFINWLPLKTYQKNRFLSCINPFIDQYNTGYQLISGLISFASGGWTGLGFGKSVRKYTSFPACNTDFILAIIVEELGIFGFLAIWIPYMIILVTLFRYAMKIKSEQGQMVLIGTAVYLLVHCLFNVGGVTGMIPLTGVPLLMISSGGSSTAAFMMAIGLSLAVIRQYKQGEIC